MTTKQESRELLMLVHAFPPAVGTVRRTLKFAKYLPEFGWKPVVLTPRPQQLKSRDDDEVVPAGSVVVRTGRFATVSTLLQRTRKQAAAPAGVASTNEQAIARPNPRARVLAILRQLLLWSDTPDYLAGWVPHALWRGKRLARARRIAAIHASGAPFSVILAGALLSDLTRLPFIADFRDIWMLDTSDPIGTIGSHFRSAGAGARTRLLRRLERYCLSRADAMLFTSRATKKLYDEAYPEFAARSHVIFNGVDSDDFGGTVEPCERPTLAHIGTLHEFQAPQVELLMAALAHGLSQGALPTDTQLALVGPLGDALLARLQNRASELGLNEHVLFAGTVEHHAAVRWMRRSHLLAMFIGANPFIRLSKISEYVAAGRPMLAFADCEGETALDVRAYGGTVVAGTRVEEVARIVGDLLRQGLAMPPGAYTDPIAHPHPLNRRTEAAQLAEILEGLCMQSPLPVRAGEDAR